jgi:hypothetical protein
MQAIAIDIINDVTAGAVVAAIGAILVWLTRLPKRLMNMTEDWNGEEARPGIEARPGVMVRLLNIEKSQAIMDMKISTIEHEVNFNSGTSIKDAIHRVDKRTADLDTKLTAHLDSQKP